MSNGQRDSVGYGMSGRSKFCHHTLAGRKEMCAGIDLANHLLFGNVHAIEYWL